MNRVVITGLGVISAADTMLRIFGSGQQRPAIDWSDYDNTDRYT